MLSERVQITVSGVEIDFDWGQPHQLGTAAYWVDQTQSQEAPPSYRLGQTLVEEIGVCILGGFGLPADIGLAAFEATRDAGVFEDDRRADVEDIRCVLAEPLTVPGREKPVRYRFPNQRAERLHAAIEYVRDEPDWDSALELRDWLVLCPGVGPKTASWVARNWSGEDGIAIIDVHVHRAGVAAGFFSKDWRLPHHYGEFEEAFCAVAEVGEVSSAALDACIWDQMSSLGRGSWMIVGPASS